MAHPNWTRRVIFFVALLFAAVFLLSYSIFLYSRSHVSSAVSEIFDVNPLLRSDDEVIGKWSGKDGQLILAVDKTFIYQTQERTETGNWYRSDWNLYLKGKNYSAEMRFVTLSEQYLILTHPPDFSTDEGNHGLAEAIVYALQKVKEPTAPSAP